MKKPIRKIAINTGGGDAPGLNAVICAIVKTALQRGWRCVGIRDGYNGLLFPEEFKGDGLLEMTQETVAHITNLGGTILGTTNRGNPMKYPVLQPDGTHQETDITDRLVEAIRREEIDALVAIGGDGSLTIADHLCKKGVRVVGVPKTIDNDLDETVITFGFDTAVSFATECVDRLHATAKSHRRILVVEVMGRYAGWIALNTGVSGDADVVLIPEIPYEIGKVADAIKRRMAGGQTWFMVLVAEGARPKDGNVVVKGKSVGQAERLGGIGEQVSRELERLTGKESRAVVLGHLLRGGSPTTFDRLIGLRFGAAAVRALEAGEDGVMVALDPPTVKCVPLAKGIGRMKCVDPGCDTVQTARDLGISFGDR